MIWLVVIAAALVLLFVGFRYVEAKTSAHEKTIEVTDRLDDLKKTFSSLALNPPLNEIAELGKAQTLRLEAFMSYGERLLNERFDTSELTYRRFQSGLTNGSAALFAQLKDSADCMKQASIVGGTTQEGRALLTKVNEQLGSSESGLKTFATAVEQIAAIQDKQTSTALADSIQDLEKIAARAEHLSLAAASNATPNSGDHS